MDEAIGSKLPDPVPCALCGSTLALDELVRMSHIGWSADAEYYYDGGDSEMYVYCAMCDTYVPLRDLHFRYEESDDWGELIPVRRRAMAK